MAAKETNLLKGKWFAAIVMLMTILSIASLFVPTMIESNINKELAYISKIVGEQEAIEIYARASGTTDKILYESGAVEWLRNLLLPKDYLHGMEPANGKKTIADDLWESIDNAIHATAMNLDLFLLRLQMFKAWMAGLIVLLVASFLSGYWMREIKKHGFEYSSPMRHGVARRLIYTIPFILMLYVVAPFAIPPVFIPMILMVFCFAVMMLVANTIKRV